MRLKKQLKHRLHELNTAQIIALGFAGVIFVGGLILWLPFCAAPGQATSFSDAMFTAATSVCVTGLVTVTTATHWSMAGKAVILLLIQIGGIGLIALASIIFVGLRKKISLRNRRMIQESYNLDKMSGMVNVVRKVIVCVLGAEAIGAVLYSFCFIPEFGVAGGIWRSVFTSVSAFCNAGIDLFGDNSLAGYVENPLVNFTTMGLIIMAGLGFTVWWDIWGGLRKIFKREMPAGRLYKNLRLHSKIVLTMTGILVAGGALLILLFDFNNPGTLHTPLSGCNHENGGIFHHSTGQIFQRICAAVPVSHVCRRFPHGNGRRCENHLTGSSCSQPEGESAGKKGCGGI